MALQGCKDFSLWGKHVMRSGMLKSIFGVQYVTVGAKS